MGAALLLRRFSAAVPAARPAGPQLVNPKEIQDKIDSTLRDGWAVLVGLPYFVERTKVGRNLPVYTDVRRNGQLVFTIVRRIYGSTLRDEIAQTLPPATKVESRANLCQIRIKGRYLEQLRALLTEKGF